MNNLKRRWLTPNRMTDIINQEEQVQRVQLQACAKRINYTRAAMFVTVAFLYYAYGTTMLGQGDKETVLYGHNADPKRMMGQLLAVTFCLVLTLLTYIKPFVFLLLLTAIWSFLVLVISLTVIASITYGSVRENYSLLSILAGQIIVLFFLFSGTVAAWKYNRLKKVIVV